MKTEMEQTPGPLKVVNGNEIIDANGALIAEVITIRATKDPREAENVKGWHETAEFMVRAYNNHEELIKMLIIIKEHFEGTHFATHAMQIEKRLLPLIKDAIAKAEGK